ncbi:MAG: AarF/ABC1/UbiB kinase family protein [Candidatus Thermoplasmatota archaeon]|nr:AarF/ABC1/UbiB kinase family protein [Candidatus Thermoplasmatota archaeon]MCL5731682.1 AarF/ABC1/UbiB kinase family protein [Candidatus Thermoplasmatota archaeon]
MTENEGNPYRGVLRQEIHVIRRLYPVFRRYVKDRNRIKKEKDHQFDPKIEYNGKRAVEAFIDLGPTFIKLGQVLSARPDLLPNEYIASFQRLQDDVPPEDFKLVKPLLEKNLGKLEDVFEEFDPVAISGASLGQVYLARTRGKRVAVKVNRPNVSERIRKDLYVIRRLLRFARGRIDNFLYISLENVIEDFSSRIYDELDYLKEKSNMDKIRKNISGREKVIIPRVIEDLTTKEVLVMEYIDGIKITDRNRLMEKNIDLQKLAFHLDLMFIRMILKDDLFHGDPHPGNISVTEDGTIILYDFGMVGRLDGKTRDSLITLYVGLLSSDADLIIDALLSLNALSPAANRGIIRRSIEVSMAGLRGINPDEREVREIFAIANDVIFEFPFRLPRALVLYMRMSSLLEGICMHLDPDFRFIRVLRQILYNEGVLNTFYSSQLKKFISQSIISVEKGLELLPLMKRKLEEENGDARTKSSRFVEISIFLGFSLVALAFMYRYYELPSLILMAAAGVGFLIALIRRK